MSKLFGCVTCRAQRKKKQSPKTVRQNGNHNGLTAVTWDNDFSSTHAGAKPPQDGSVKETVSISTSSQIPGDATSTSLGGWSGNQVVDGFDASKVNLVPSEDSYSLTRPLLRMFARPSEIGEDYLDRFESLVGRLEKLAGVGTQSETSGLDAFQTFMSQTLPVFTSLSRELGHEIKKQSLLVEEGFVLVRDLIKFAQSYSKPPPNILENYYKPVSYKLLEISDFDRQMSDPLTKNALIMIADSAMVLAWFSHPTASVFVKEICESTNAFANKTFQYCHSNQTQHAQWIRAWMACLRGLQQLVDRHFSHGLIWNPSGPKAPSPPKPVPPHLLYESSIHSPPTKPSIERRQRAQSLFASPGPKRQYKSQFELLSEISQTRQHLRHIQDPDLWQ